MSRIEAPDGAVIHANSAKGHSFAQKYIEICHRQENEKEAWVADLRSKGVSASHPDDGWVDRENNTIHFVYPQFMDGVDVGSIVALGWPRQHRLVRITKQCPLLWGGNMWEFTEVDEYLA